MLTFYEKHAIIKLALKKSERRAPSLLGRGDIMSKRAKERIEEMRAIMKNAGAKELTPEDGVILRRNLRGEYFVEEARYIIACLEAHLFMWDVFPQG